mmetsp:Transcript_3564/g.3012  ORF Transcript_3564/g.3012 Transcript_3564/m.3012 type:complete len:105 (-) Transcript_3564:20-334(-)
MARFNAKDPSKVNTFQVTDYSAKDLEGPKNEYERKKQDRLKRFGTVSTSKNPTVSPAELEKLEQRAKKFGGSNQELDIQKRNKRFERFGTNIEATRQTKREKHQ